MREPETCPCCGGPVLPVEDGEDYCPCLDGQCDNCSAVPRATTHYVGDDCPGGHRDVPCRHLDHLDVPVYREPPRLYDNDERVGCPCCGATAWVSPGETIGPCPHCDVEAVACTCDPPNEFGIAACALPSHCEHASRTGDGVGGWVCDVCGHVTTDVEGGEASASDGTAGPTPAVPETRGRA